MEEQCLCPLPSLPFNRVRVHHVVRFAHRLHVSVIVLYPGQYHSFSIPIIKITPCGGERMCCQYVCILYDLPHFGCQIYLSPQSLDHSSSSLILHPHLFGIPFLFGLTFPQQFIVLVCRLSNNAGHEKKLSMYNVCSTCSSLRQVMLQLHVQLSWKELHVSCLCLNTRSYCKYVPQNHTASRVLSQNACVSLVTLKMTVPLKRTMI